MANIKICGACLLISCTSSRNGMEISDIAWNANNKVTNP